MAVLANNITLQSLSEMRNEWTQEIKYRVKIGRDRSLDLFVAWNRRVSEGSLAYVDANYSVICFLPPTMLTNRYPPMLVEWFYRQPITSCFRESTRL